MQAYTDLPTLPGTIGEAIVAGYKRAIHSANKPDTDSPCHTTTQSLENQFKTTDPIILKDVDDYDGLTAKVNDPLEPLTQDEKETTGIILNEINKRPILRTNSRLVEGHYRNLALCLVKGKRPNYDKSRDYLQTRLNTYEGFLAEQGLTED
jgi:hypothetical protein